MNYNTQLCKTALGKKLLARVTQCTCFWAKTVTAIFLGALARSANQSVKRPFYHRTKKDMVVIGKVIALLPSRALPLNFFE
ncbi:hypothetical protein [Flavobacterium nackdongense]|uniref:Uncharacterized protein n=1 Tax=Flavobacterium nackdongense TaxID=2547394 RepID=A0A4P6YIK2_9FLAO|nr:hypothetical protein [Flavobacterium nackdongense]QBN20430.1 hypothetical protein E1750_17080 [Flavobacterium nackdongense]